MFAKRFMKRNKWNGQIDFGRF